MRRFDERYDRRTFVRSIGVAVAGVGLAGCASPGEGGGEGEADEEGGGEDEGGEGDEEEDDEADERRRRPIAE
ncbi:hypothetical protein [Salinigranum sp.]|uniref:hypothetical protein n=1 Tax=Salinigranum sp. TaxID=1966351 RepID=UPI0035674E7F